MDPTSLMTFSSPVAFNKPLFDIDVYRKSDGVGTASQCMRSIDSLNGVEQGSSLESTNRIFFLLNECVRRPLREIPDFPKVAEHPDGATIQKVDQIFQQFLSQCPASIGTGLAREWRIDQWKRVNNILQAYFKAEFPYLMRHLMRTRGMGVKEAGALLYAKCPGSLADGIGVFADREAKEELDRGLPKLVADAIAKGLTPEEIKGAYQACVAKMSQHKDFSAV